MTSMYDAESPTAPIVATSAGQVQGTLHDGIERFLGIPYAGAPVGELRFELPQPGEQWDGVRDATAYGATAPQNPYEGAIGQILATVTIPGENFLNLNVFTPHQRFGELLPVIVWFHGGSLQHGSNALTGYDGGAFARDGVVFVAANYRLGPEGFSVLDGAPLNLGLADQVAALRWAQQEIDAFGGDPRRVTIMGESAGGNSVAALLASAQARPLFSQAIIQSGPLTAQEIKKAGKVTAMIAKELKLEQSREAFSSATPEELLVAHAKVTAGSTPLTGGAGHAIAIGEQLVPENPFDALLAGAGSDVPLLIGTTRDEARLWLIPTGLANKITWLHLGIAALKVGVSRSAMKLFTRNRAQESKGEILGAIATDVLLRVPMNQLADARTENGASTFVYEFSWESPIQGLKAAHAMELGFVFDQLQSADSISMAGRDTPQELATDMHKAWVQFAQNGQPGWEQWGPARPVKTFDGVSNGVVYAPRDEERAAISK